MALRLLHMRPICISHLREANPRQYVCFPQKTGLQVSTHVKHVGGLQFGISQSRKDNIGFCRISLTSKEEIVMTVKQRKNNRQEKEEE